MAGSARSVSKLNGLLVSVSKDGGIPPQIPQVEVEKEEENDAGGLIKMFRNFSHSLKLF